SVMSDWSDEVLPILQSIYQAGRTNPMGHVDTRVMLAAIGREADDPDAARVIRELADAGYIEIVADPDASFVPILVRTMEKGLQVVAGWPTAGGESLFSRLLAELDERVAKAATEEERTRLVRFRDALVGVGRDVFTNVVSSAAEGAVRGLTG